MPKITIAHDTFDKYFVRRSYKSLINLSWTVHLDHKEMNTGPSIIYVCLLVENCIMHVMAVSVEADLATPFTPCSTV